MNEECGARVWLSKMMTFPAKKTSNTELFIDERAELYIEKWEPNFLTKSKGVKCWCQDQQDVEVKNHNGSLFKMSKVRREWCQYLLKLNHIKTPKKTEERKNHSDHRFRLFPMLSQCAKSYKWDQSEKVRKCRDISSRIRRSQVLKLVGPYRPQRKQIPGLGFSSSESTRSFHPQKEIEKGWRKHETSVSQPSKVSPQKDRQICGNASGNLGKAFRFNFDPATLIPERPWSARSFLTCQ